MFKDFSTIWIYFIMIVITMITEFF